MTDLILRTSVLLVSAWLASRLLTRATAATRHLLWHAVVVAVLAAPVLGRLAPEIRLPVADQWLDHTFVSSIAAPLRGQRLPAPLPATNVTRDSPSSVRDVPRAATRATGGELAAAGAITWLAGSLLMFLWFGSGIIAAAALVRRCRPAAAEWQAEAARLGSEMGLRTSAAVRVLPQDSSPLTIGWFRSTILLPPPAAEWDADRRRSVLLHELAHVRRRDCLVQALAQLACSLYWFNPLMWVAASALRRERERACDDEVLVRGAQASSYASHLLAIARDLQPRLASHAAVAMALPREL